MAASADRRGHGHRIRAMLFALALAVPATGVAPALATVPPADVVGDAAVTGPAETVFGQDDFCGAWTNPDPLAPAEARKIHDSPNQPARAFRNGSGQTVLVDGNRVTRVGTGSDLNHVTRDCTDPPIHTSAYLSGPFAFDFRTWLTSIYVTSKGAAYGLMSSDYHAGLDSGAPAGSCPSGIKNKCLFQAVTWVSSSDWGRTFTHPTALPGKAPSYVVASLPYQYAPDQGPMGYSSPSNIVRGQKPDGSWDGYYYAAFKANAYGAQQKGTCMMRTSDLAHPGTWRAWGGTAFDVRFVNPYRGPGGSAYPWTGLKASPELHVCAPVSPAEIGTLHKSLTYNTYLHRYMLVNSDVRQGVEGVYFSTSTDLVNWTPERLLWATPISTGEDDAPTASTDVIDYASLLDPSSTDRNYSTTGQTPYLYFTYYNWRCDPGDAVGTCGLAANQSLERVPVRFTLASG